MPSPAAMQAIQRNAERLEQFGYERCDMPEGIELNFGETAFFMQNEENRMIRVYTDHAIDLQTGWSIDFNTGEPVEPGCMPRPPGL